VTNDPKGIGALLVASSEMEIAEGKVESTKKVVKKA
jgi:hypothetical protein